jgi:hypothetical protein
MGWTCSTHGEVRNENILVRKPDGKRQLERRMRKWKDNIKMNLNVNIDIADWISLAQSTVGWRTLVNSITNLWFPYKSGRCSIENSDFSFRASWADLQLILTVDWHIDNMCTVVSCTHLYGLRDLIYDSYRTSLLNECHPTKEPHRWKRHVADLSVSHIISRPFNVSVQISHVKLLWFVGYHQNILHGHHVIIIYIYIFFYFSK